MVQKEHLHFSILITIVALFVLAGCTNTSAKKEELVSTSSFFVDTTLIPNDTISSTNQKLKLDNGIYYYNDKVYSGYIKVLYPDKSVNSVGGILNGMLYGKSLSFYTNGKVKDIRMYKDNKSLGKQIGYWENGHQKFEFIYLDDKREGLNKQWYESGRPYAFLTFKDDREDGMQQAWRENGKVFINYQVKDGFRYGLQKSALCYTLEKEKFK